MKRILLIAAMILIAEFTIGQTLQKGALVGLHKIAPVLAPGVSMDQYLAFIKDKLIPAYERNYPGLKCFLLKSIRGECTDCIILVFLFESEAARDKYFKPDGDYTTSGIEGKKNMQPVLDEVSRMDQSKEVYTDYLVQ
jgi:hypothetical protein